MIEAPVSIEQLVFVLLLSVLCGFVGTFVVLRRMVALGGGIAHAAFGGIGLGVVFGFDPRLGAAGTAAAVALFLARRRHDRPDRQDASIGVLWAVGMAAGMILLAGSGIGGIDVEGYLFGDIETLRRADLLVLGSLVAAVLAVHFLRGRELVAAAFDPDHATLQGLAVRRLTLLALLLVALSVVALLQLVGVVLAIALLVLPPLTALRLWRGLAAVVAGAAATAAVISIAGLLIGARTGWPSGPAIVLVGATVLGMAQLVRTPATRRR